MPKFRCQNCGQKVSCPDDAVGKRFRCPRCKASIIVPPLHDPGVISPSATTPVPAVPGEPMVGDSDPTPLLGVAPVRMSPDPAPTPTPIPTPAPAPPTRPVVAPSVLPDTAKMAAVEPTGPPSAEQASASVEQTATPIPVAPETPVPAPAGASEVEQPLAGSGVADSSPPKPEEKRVPAAPVAVPVSAAADTAPVAAMGVPRRRRSRVLLAAAAAFLVGAAAGAGLVFYFQGDLLKQAPGVAEKLAELRKDAEKLEADGLKEAALWKYEEVLRLVVGREQDTPAMRDLAGKARKEKERLSVEVMTARGFVLLGGDWVPKERADLERMKTERDALSAERDTLKAERDALKAQLETTRIPSGRVRVSVSVRGGRFGVPWPDAGALAILIPKGEPGKLPALATLRDRGKFRENQQAASEKGAYIGFTGRDGRLTFEGVKSGGYNLVIVSGNVPDDPANARTNRERLARFFDAAGLANQVHTAEADVAPGEQKDISHQFSVLRRP